MCVGCRQHGGKRVLLRVVRTPDGHVVVDPVQRAPGRGAYVHEDAECIRLARRRKGLERALRTPIPEALWEAVSGRAG
ncbi:MAG: YlxR family protein [Candidatus Dormibacteraeota bacterium]|nr:YlxR family protein [Candidatus Dormibacteraeota bacterium]